MQKCEIGGVEVKVGQVWERTDGSTCVISEVMDVNSHSYPIKSSDELSYTKRGTEFKNGSSLFNLTKLVKDVPEVISVQQKEKEMKTVQSTNKTFDFKVGEKYLTRSGEVVTIDETAQSNPENYNRTEYTAHGSNKYYYTNLGRIFVAHEFGVDIVAKAPVRIQSSTSTNQSNQSNQLTHSQISKMRKLLLVELATVNHSIEFEEEREVMFFANSDYSTKDGRLYFGLLTSSKNKLRKLKKQRNDLADTLKKLKKQQQEILRSNSK